MGKARAIRWTTLGVLLASVSAFGALAAAPTPPSQAVGASLASARVTAKGLQVKTAAGVLSIEPWSERIIHVRFGTKPAWTSPHNSWVVGAPVRTRWTTAETADAWILKTAALQVRVGKADGAVSFLDASGTVLLSEGAAQGRSPAAETGPVTQTFATPTPLYGLGQHQNGLLDYAGASVRLQQENREVGVPMMVSPKGFGLLWNNAAVTEVQVARPAQPPLVIRSEAGGGIDYDFIYGPQLDQVIAGYRQLTGDAPLMPRWMFGLWQSKEHYERQDELLADAARYRALGAPLDVMVQDWQYWRQGQWGSHQFDPARYPDPKAMVEGLHALHLHAAISTWARFDLGTANLAELDRAGAVYPKVYPNVYPAGQGRWYDPFSAAGRSLYWAQIQRNLGVLGFDAWWLDASEAELGGGWGEMRDVTTAGGPGREVYNAYPLMHTTAVYQGARRDMGGRRPVILTRSAFAGQQRNAAITWSGDTQGDWETFRRQVPAALNFSLSGIPYWSADIGGFFGGDPMSPDYAELFTRWYEFAVFNPMFRVHGTGANKVLWAFPADTQKVLLSYDQLRYRLLPYIYSTAWAVTRQQDTFMRALAMDFRTDSQALKVADQYMFGRALLVSPVMQAGAQGRKVYLPAGTDWYDFWTGKRLAGGQSVTAAAAIDQIPVQVRAGSILPLGPVKPYADAPSTAPLELRVYPGRDGVFELYDDEGDGFGYQQGRYAMVRITWRDQGRVLELAPRRGSFPGMARTQRLKVVCGPRAEAAAVDFVYTGAAAKIPLPACAG